MSKRLQVLFEETELAEIRKLARRQRLTTAEWVRQALRRARRAEPGADARKKLTTVRAAVDHAFPTADIDQMLAEIEQGYAGRHPVIFVDSNIPMYLVGGPHAHKADAQRLLETAIAAGERLVTDAEVLQEILHRYVAIDRRDAIQPAFDAILGVVDEVFVITLADVERAKAIVLGKRRLSSRDALHAAVMERERTTRIMSFDSGFDGLPGVTRLGA